MYSEFAAELWNEMKNMLNPIDREQAADTLVSMLIDYDEDINDIKKAFKGDEFIKNALMYHDNNIDEDEDEDYDDYIDGDDYN